MYVPVFSPPTPEQIDKARQDVREWHQKRPMVVRPDWPRPWWRGQRWMWSCWICHATSWRAYRTSGSAMESALRHHARKHRP